jgi:hypothetical protein
VIILKSADESERKRRPTTERSFTELVRGVM